MMRFTPSGIVRAAAAAVVVFFTACAAVSPTPPLPDYAALVASPARTDADRKNDQRRDPVKLLAFYGVRPAMRVLDMGAGGGYNTELLSRAVGSDGVVYAQNSRYMLENIVKGRFDERMQRGMSSNVVALVREFDDPVPHDVRNLDLVTLNFVYHDIAYLGADRARMNRAIFDALKRGGIYIVADHSARAGAGAGVAKSLHRIDESLVRGEVEAAGFRLAASADFLRNPQDPRDASVFRNPVRNDEFVLKFVKP